MRLKTIIVDDEPIALEKLSNYTHKIPWLQLDGMFESSLEAADHLNNNHTDLVITDIQMPDVNGMEMIEALAAPPMVIFTTAYDRYAIDSYKLSAVDYLLKPFTFVDFQKAASKALRQYHSEPVIHNDSSSIVPASQPSEALFIKVDHKYLRIMVEKIKYIKGYGEYLQIYLEGEKVPMLTLSSFNATQRKLPDHFLQLHRSYIVNMNQVIRIERNRVILDEETYIPVSDSCKTTLQTYLSKLSIGPAIK